MRSRSQLEQAEDFTEAYRRNEHAEPALREAMCLKAQYPAILDEIRPGDRFAGRVVWPAVGFRFFSGPGYMGYYCDRRRVQAELDKPELPAADRERWMALAEFWKTRGTFDRIKAEDDALARPGLSAAVRHDDEYDGPKIGNYVFRASGLNLDFGHLLKGGIPGLAADVERFRASAEGQPDRLSVYEGMRLGLSVLADSCRHYAAQAAAQADVCGGERRKQELGAMSGALSAIASRPPATLAEAIQLFWLYARLANADNFGRMDVYLGEFLVRDLESGRLDEGQALALLQALWRLIADEVPGWSGRIFVGGRGRPNEAAADRFALLAMEATRTVRKVIPQLSLRCHEGMNPALFSRALDTIGEGCVYPMLYNDDVNVPALQNSFRVGREEAEQYIASDCGEFGLEHRSIGFPDANLVLARALVAALHNGMDPVSGKPMGLPTGACEELATFDALWNAYARQIEYFAGVVLDRLAPLYRVLAQDTRALLPALLTDDCLSRGQGLFSGVRYKGLLVEIYGTINVADSLVAISQEVYERQTFGLPDLVRMVDADFAGFERERQVLLKAPKYGNDDDVADAMARKVYTHICETVKAHRERLKLDFCLADLINAGGHVALGKEMGAMPDGRKAGMPLANANGPANGRDRRGPTALLNSLVNLHPGDIGGQVQHLKLSRELFTRSRAKAEALLKAYFASGGSQVTVMAVSPDDLEKAMKDPENHGDLLVRIGGYCERFVSLPCDMQEEIVARTLQN